MTTMIGRFTRSIAHQLVDDVGADDTSIVNVTDSERLVFTCGTDEWTTMADFGDCYGTYEWVQPHPYMSYDCERPKGFDGRARKLWVNRGDRVWWQPPADVHDPEQVAAMARYFVDLWEHGFLCLTVTRQHKCEMGGWHDVDVASLSGVDVDAGSSWELRRSALVDVVEELLDELEGDK